MKRIQSILAAVVLTMVVSSNAFAGNIHFNASETSIVSLFGNIHFLLGNIHF